VSREAATSTHSMSVYYHGDTAMSRANYRTKRMYESMCEALCEALNLPPNDFEIDDSDTNIIPDNIEPIPAWNNGFNQFGSKENHPLYGKSLSIETKELIRNAAIGRKASIETRFKMSKSHMGRSSAKGMLGKKHSEETKNKMSKKSHGFSDECRRKQKEHMIGKKLSDETRAKMRESHLKRNAEKRSTSQDVFSIVTGSQKSPFV